MGPTQYLCDPQSWGSHHQHHHQYKWWRCHRKSQGWRCGQAGGFDGGLSKTNGQGPGKGKGYTGTTNGGGGAYGGQGSESDAGYSLTYGSPDLSTHLLGGSGAGGGDWYPGVPVGVPSNYLPMEMVCLPLEEASKQTVEMLPWMMTGLVVVVLVVPSAWKVVPLWHLVLSKQRVEAVLLIHLVVVGASPLKPTAT